MKEILSLQFGHYANFIGTHWWNIQETGFNYTEESEINHDVLFREGLTPRGDITYTPRLLLVDLKGSLKSLGTQGELYEQISDPLGSVPWPKENVEVVTEDITPKNSFQKALEKQGADLNAFSDQLNSDVKVWSDFTYSRFHPRSVNVTRDYQHESSDVPFNVFHLGKNLWKQSEFSDDFCDKIRNYVEECDSLQGFHVTVDAINAFGGLSSSCLEYLQDDYDKKSVLVFAAIPAHYSDYSISTSEEREESTKNDSIRLLNLAMSIEAFSENSSLVIPLCTGSKGWRQPGPKRDFRHVTYNQTLPYHTSAIIASAIDTFTMSYRIKNGFTLGDFCTDLSRNNRKIAAASLGLPFSLKPKEDLIDCLDNWEGPLWQTLTPNCEIPSDKTIQIITARGLDETRIKRPVHQAKKQREMAAYRCETAKEMLSLYLSCSSYATASHVTTVKTPMSVKTPYPNIFDDFIASNGDILDFPSAREQGMKSVPVIAGCHSNSSIGNMLENLHREAARIKIARFPQFGKAGLESDEYLECLTRLLDLRECYEESFE